MAEQRSTRLYLLRHGATPSNRVVPYRIQGQHADRSLDDLGQEQARRAGGALTGVACTAVYSSPLARAIETARIVADGRGLEPVAVPALAEADVGRWEGLTWDEASRLDPEHHRRFLANPGTVPYLGGESFLDVQQRAAPALAEIAAQHPGGRVLVVAHNVVNRAVLAGVLGLPIDQARGIRQSNCGINVLEFVDGAFVVETLNAALHLEGLDPRAFGVPS